MKKGASIWPSENGTCVGGVGFSSRPMGGLNLAVAMLQRGPIASTRPFQQPEVGFSLSLLFSSFFPFFWEIFPPSIQLPGLQKL